MQPESTLVSIGIPTYNRPEGLRSILDDIRNQSYKNLEIIISDNCSEDLKVSEIIKEYSLIDSRIKVYFQPHNIGAERNFQFVLSQASGSFFFWAADDDGFFPEFIERCLRLHYLNPTAVLTTTACQVMDDWRKVTYIHQNFQTLGLKKCDCVKETLKNVLEANFIFYSLYKTVILKQILFSTYFGSDLIFMAKISQFGHFVADNQYVGYKYLLGPQGISSNFEAYKTNSGFSNKLARHFFITISFIKGLREIFSFSELSLFCRLSILFFFKKEYKKNYRWEFVISEFSSFRKIIYNKIRVFTFS